MRRRPSGAMIMACVALFFSLAGTGIAASHYLITSLSQIAPKVRRELHDQRGLRGPRGFPGAFGLDWSQVYYAASDVALLTTSQPTANLTVQCHLRDRVIAGGYEGTGEIVTNNGPDPTWAYPGLDWHVIAHLDPTATTGNIAAWALCEPA